MEFKAQVSMCFKKAEVEKSYDYNSAHGFVDLLKLFKCPIQNCNRLFKEKGNLRTHIRVHQTGEKPYFCNFQGCQKCFVTLGNLNSHKLNHSEIKRFNCTFEGCKKAFNLKLRMDIHLRTHLGSKPYKCEFGGCEKTFNEKGNLKTHMRSHSNAKPYKCLIAECQSEFKYSINLRYHLKMHNSKNDSFYCKDCGLSFIRYSSLLNHLSVHQNLILDSKLVFQKIKTIKDHSNSVRKQLADGFEYVHQDFQNLGLSLNDSRDYENADTRKNSDDLSCNDTSTQQNMTHAVTPLISCDSLSYFDLSYNLSLAKNFFGTIGTNNEVLNDLNEISIMSQEFINSISVHEELFKLFYQS